MSVYDLSKLTLAPEEASDVSKVIFEQVINTELQKHHALQTKITYDQKIPFIGNLGLSGSLHENCKPTPNTGKIPISNKTWAPRPVSDRFEHCKADVDPLFSLFRKSMRENSQFYAELNGEELGVIYQRVSDALRLAIMRLVWFGDTGANVIASGGVLTAGTDPKYFKALNGLWKQILTDIPITSKRYVKIDANDGATTSAQAVSGDTFAFDLFKQMYKSADARLKQAVSNGQKMYIHCSSAIAENYEDFKAEKSLNFTLEAVENGTTRAFFKNIEVVPRYDWDATIEAYQNNGTKLNLPNRALLTVSGNIPVGVSTEDSLTKLESFYDKYNQVNVIDYIVNFDVKFLEDYMAVAAY